MLQRIKEGLKSNKVLKFSKDNDLVVMDSYQGIIIMTHLKNGEEISSATMNWSWIDTIAQVYRDWEVIGL